MSRRCKGDGGAALLETALVAPVFLVIVFGILEFGLVYRDFLTVTDAASDSSKVGSIQGPYPTATGQTADYSIIKNARENLANLRVEDVERVVVFKANPSGAGSALDQVPQACKTGSFGPNQAAKCNVYPGAQAFLAVQAGNANYFKCGNGGAGFSCGWNPDQRANGPKWSDIDHLGVYIKVNHPMLTGFFGDDFTIDYAAINRLEPGKLEE